MQLQGDKSTLYDLFEQWISGDENWKRTQVYARITSSSGTVKAAGREWVTRAELEQKMGKEAAESMIQFLEENRPDLCRDRPDAPGIKDIDISKSIPSNVLFGEAIPLVPTLCFIWQECRQYHVLIKDSQEERKEDWVSRVMECKDGSSSSSSSSDKKRKACPSLGLKCNDRRIHMLQIYIYIRTAILSPKA